MMSPGSRLGLPSDARFAGLWGYTLTPPLGLMPECAMISPGLRLGLPSDARFTGLQKNQISLGRNP